MQRGAMPLPGFCMGFFRFITRLSSIMSQKSTEVVKSLCPSGVTDSDSITVWSTHAASPSVLPVSRENQVVSAIWYKERTGAQHEALELKVTGGPQNQNTLWLLVERGGAVAQRPSPSTSTNSSTVSLNRSADDSGQLSSQRHAKDTVAVHAVSPISGTLANFHPVATLNIPANSTNPLTVCDLAALLSVVSQSRPEYNVISYNCYWFAAIVIGAIEKVHGGQVVLSETGTSPGYLGCFRVIKEKDITGGLLEAVPAWATLKASYRARKTAQEVSAVLFMLL